MLMLMMIYDEYGDDDYGDDDDDDDDGDDDDVNKNNEDGDGLQQKNIEEKFL